jgi:RimJ/RimL family protein N-acetyltransferase
VTNPAQREATLWYVIEAPMWGRGYGTAAARRLLTFGFESLGLHRIFADVDARNISSLRVAEKLGMQREAHFRKNMWVKGEWTDSVICAILEDDWRAAVS